jgi:hypothetical protein
MKASPFELREESAAVYAYKRPNAPSWLRLQLKEDVARPLGGLPRPAARQALGSVLWRASSPRHGTSPAN